MARKTEADWLEAGLKLLAEHGEKSLRIDAVAKQLGVTLGSFYHHFENRRAFLVALLDLWAARMTNAVFEGAFVEGDARRTIEQYEQVVIELWRQVRLEQAVRAWAMHDPLAARYQRKVDQARLQFNRRIAALTLDDEQRVARLGNLIYAAFVGAYQIMPKLALDEVLAMYQELRQVYGAEHRRLRDSAAATATKAEAG